MRLSNPASDPIRRLAQFCLQFADHRNYWEGFYRGSEKSWYPSASNDEIIRKNKFKPARHKEIAEHAIGQRNIGYNNSPLGSNDTIMVMIDPDSYHDDPHRQNKLNNFCTMFNQIMGKNIYTEASTQSNDRHLYVFIRCPQMTSTQKNTIMSDLESVVRDIALQCGLKDGEVKGLCPNNTYQNKTLSKRETPAPAKFPRDAERIDELEASYVFTHHEIYHIIDNYEMPQPSVITMPVKSTGFWYDNFSKIMNDLVPDITRNLFDKRKLTKDRNIYAVHLAIYTYLLYFLKKRQIDAPSLALIEFHWKNLIAKGLTDVSWNKEVAIACNRILSLECQMIEWFDNRYCKAVTNGDGEVVVQGKCCRFALVNEVFSLLRKGGKYGHGIFAKKYNGQKLRPKYDASIRFSEQKLRKAG